MKTTFRLFAALLLALIAAGCADDTAPIRSTPATNPTESDGSAETSQPNDGMSNDTEAESDPTETTTTTESEPAAPADAAGFALRRRQHLAGLRRRRTGTAVRHRGGRTRRRADHCPVRRPQQHRQPRLRHRRHRPGDGRRPALGSGEDQGVEPAVVQPGEIAFGYIYFSAAPAATATIEVSATADDAADDLFGSVPLLVGEANLIEGEYAQQIVGEVSAEEVESTGSARVMALCVDQAGTPASATTGYTDGQASILPGTAATFSIDLFGDPCPTFLIGASGYPES